MTGKKMIKLTAIHIAAFLTGTVLFILLFHTPLFRNIDVLFYRGIALLVFTCVLIGAVLLTLMKTVFKDTLIIRDILLSIVIIGCVHMVVFTHLPVTAERSISVYILGVMSQNAGQSFSEEAIRDTFIRQYVDDFGAFEKRFHEQVVTGTLEPAEDGYQISAFGRELVEFYKVIADLYGIEKRLIEPQNSW